MSTPDIPFERSYWADPDKLLAGYYPGDADEAVARHKLTRLLECGIRHVVDLIKEQQVHTGNLVSYSSQLASIAQELGIDVTYALHPITDQDIPTREMMTSVLDDIDRAINDGRPVYVHCMGGIGRTGTVVGCYLSRHDIAVGEQAIDRVRELRIKDPYRHVKSPNTEDQRRMVRSWKPEE